MADKLLNVKASTAQEFLVNAHKAMRDPKKLGDTKYDLQVKFQLDYSGGYGKYHSNTYT